MVCQKDWDTGKLNSEPHYGVFFLLPGLKIEKFAVIIAERLEFVSHQLSFTYQIMHSAIWQLQILGRFYTGNLYP